MRFAWSVLVIGLMSTTAMAQEPGPSAATAPSATTQEAAAAPEKRLTFTAGFDLATAYIFRGIYQEDHGVIVPPFVDLGISLYEGSGTLTGISANVGNWNSMHSGPTGKWYEADFYGSVTFSFGKWQPGALFTSYTSPNDTFGTVHELAAVLAYDDSESAFPLSPTATLAFELHNQADGGESKGTYLELGIGPSVPLGSSPVSLAIPVKLGLSLNDYYEGPTGDKAFGYLSTGLIASVPLKVGGKGSWEAHGGANLVWLGDSMKLLNDNDRFKPIGTIGISFTY
jgi:hypothetical protein